MCITAQNLEKKSHNPFISGSGSFSVIIVGTTGKLVTPRLRCWHDLANSTVELNIRVGIVALLIGHKTSLHWNIAIFSYYAYYLTTKTKSLSTRLQSWSSDDF